VQADSGRDPTSLSGERKVGDKKKPSVIYLDSSDEV